MTEARVQEGQALHRAGKLAEAIERYAGVLGDDPQRLDVWQLKAIAEHQAGALDAAWASVNRVIEIGGEVPPALLLAGRILQDRGDLPGAESHFARARAAKPDWAPPAMSLGEARMDQGNFAGALEAFRAALDLDGQDLRGWNNLGLAQMALEKGEDALRTFNHALTLNPAYAHANFNVARLHLRRGDFDRALRHAQLAIQSEPRLVDAHLLVADLQRKRRDFTATGDALVAALRANPGNAKLLTSHAEFLWEAGFADEARDAYRRASEYLPGSLKAALGANLQLAQIYRDGAHLEATRASYAQGLENLHAVADRFRYRNASDALADARWTNFYLAYQGGDDKALQSRYGELIRRVLDPVAPQWLAPRKRRNAGGRIRVGFLSYYFYNCTAGRYFSSWVTKLDRARFETFVYYTNEWVADDTRAIAAASDHFRHLPGRSIEALAQRAIADDLDVMVYPELGMHPDTFTLASLRVAPVQVAGWGHPNTTGLPEIDWYLSSEAMEPEGAQAFYSEKLALLPGLGTRYAMPAGAAQGDRSDFGLPDDRTLYLVPQSLFKIHPENDPLLAAVAASDPKALLVFFASPHDAITLTFGTRLAAALKPHGLLLEDRAVFLPYMSHGQYLRVNELSDVMLDTLHWSGGNTSLDALAVGLPVVTLPGRFMRGRQSLGMLRTMGLEELVATSAEDYLAKAVRIANDREERSELSGRIRDAGPALFERDEPIRALESFLEKSIE